MTLALLPLWFCWDVSAGSVGGDGGVVLRHGQTQLLADGLVVHLHSGGGGLHVHGGDVGAVDQHVIGHLAGLIADVIVVDGQGGHAAAGADALLAGNHGDLGGQHHVGDELGVRGGGVVGGDIDHVRGGAGRLGDGGHVVGIGEGEALTGIAHLGQIALHLLDLIDGVGLAGAIEHTHGLGVGEQLLDHSGLLVQGSQVAGAGDVPARAARPLVDVQGGGIVGDGGANNGNRVRSGGCSLQGCGGICQDQIHIAGHKAVEIHQHIAVVINLIQDLLEFLGGDDFGYFGIFFVR